MTKQKIIRLTLAPIMIITAAPIALTWSITTNLLIALRETVNESVTFWEELISWLRSK